MNSCIVKDKLALTGDLHLGNPFFTQARSFTAFLDYLRRHELDLCMNGDGIDILQLSRNRVLLDFPQIIKHIEMLASQDFKLYYIIGNHDIYFEQFLDRWKNFVVLPFLDVISGGRRIHIEHGHLYDPLFIHYPALYRCITVFSGYFLSVMPHFYRWVMICNRSLIALMARAGLIPRAHLLEKATMIDAARDLLTRGYDVVIFGHSHRVVQLTFDGLGTYYNSGSWMRDPNHFVEISDGQVMLRRWEAGNVRTVHLS